MPVQSGPLLDLIMRLQRKSHLIAELTAAGMPNAAAEVQGGNWQTILQWIEANAPQILGFILSLVTLLGG